MLKFVREEGQCGGFGLPTQEGLEVGLHHGKLVLADEISPDTCRFWDKQTGESMDKDRFRKDLGRIEEAYQEVLKRVCG